LELQEAIRRRRMRRAFSPEPLPAEVVEHMLALATRAPSAGFTQAVEWVVLEAEDDRRRFFEAACTAEFLVSPGPMASLLRAPVIVVPVANPADYVARYDEADKAGGTLSGVPAEQWPVAYWTVDAAFGVMLLLLAAEEAGLAALFFRLHRPALGVLAALGAPTDRELIGAVALGWPAGEHQAAGSPGHRQRRPIEQLVHLGRW
jgi:nitroreductase